MKRITFVSVLFSMLFMGFANAADMKIYYTPSCKFCHLARDFASRDLAYEYQSIKIEFVNVLSSDKNKDDFDNDIRKCEYTSGGVPLIIIGEKCFQGYNKVLNDDIREAVSVGLSSEEIAQAVENRKEMKVDAKAFRKNNMHRANAIIEVEEIVEKKTEKAPVVYFYILLGILIVGFGFMIFRRKNSQ